MSNTLIFFIAWNDPKILLLIAILGIALLIYLFFIIAQLKKAIRNYDQEIKDHNARLEKSFQELEIYKQKAGESNRLVSTFLYNMSHELRTPLHAIMGFSGLIASNTAIGEEKIKFANIIDQNVDHLLELINDIFDISQTESGISVIEFSPLKVNDMINSLQTWLNLEKAKAGKEFLAVKISKANKDNDFEILTDGYKLKRSLSHLVQNAIKYTEEGFIEIGYSFSVKGTIDFFVKDDGIGFSKEKLSVLFSQFRQGDETPTRQYGGLGLGLSIAQKFATLLNGELTAESEPGKGSTFCISIPYIKSPG